MEPVEESPEQPTGTEDTEAEGSHLAQRVTTPWGSRLEACLFQSVAQDPECPVDAETDDPGRGYLFLGLQLG